MGQPWIAEDIVRHLHGQEPVQRSLEDCRQGLLEHFLFTYNYHQARRVVTDMRRVGCWYSEKIGWHARLSRTDQPCWKPRGSPRPHSKLSFRHHGLQR